MDDYGEDFGTVGDDELVNRSFVRALKVKFDDYCKRKGLKGDRLRISHDTSLRCHACESSGRVLDGGCEECVRIRREKFIKAYEKTGKLYNKCRHDFAKKYIIEVIVAAAHDGRDLRKEFDYIRKHCFNDASFFRALARALEEKNIEPLFDPVEVLLILQWEKVELFGRNLPGLKYWVGPAMAEYVRFRRKLKKDLENDVGVSDDAIDKKRSRLGFAKSHIVVKTFKYKYLPDERAQVFLETVGKKYGGKLIGKIEPILETFTVLPKSFLNRETDRIE